MSRSSSVLVAAAVVVWNNGILPRCGWGPYGRAVAGAATALTAVGVARAAGYSRNELGLSPSTVPAGLRYGAAAALIPVVAGATAVVAQPWRSGVRRAAHSADFYGWVGFRIPVGTVVAEELLFRSVLSAVLQREWSPRTARALHAVTFGLWHLRAARLAHDSVLGTVIVTAASGVLFEELRRRSDSVVAPALLHLSVNVAGAVAARAAEPGPVD
ncbi:CPBP family intramembrane glutamic endopeptidase [Rhodococcus oxybenzonivorans]|uniref:CPBP family intramembrane glutamic endopeptidase n=1 Tax=Rhodococcus oxybenzonivorans TaxID=1990687 RepID=UPI0029533FC6|nr:CPBP family intramembrane glutamic endopeptidase [Rhodococcus oxybenzonivorans]MDV7354420.1 CPBP family intramembrane glutamic endopeptidase [Rhodococcus oxybenzonivorans]